MRYYIFFLSLLVSLPSLTNDGIDSLKQAVSTLNDSSKVKTLNRIALTYSNNNVDSALYYSNLALDVAQKLEDDYLLGIAYSNMAKIYGKHSGYEKVVEYRTASLRHRIKTEDTLLIGNTYIDLGLAYTSLGRYKDALDNQLKALELFKTTKNKEKIASCFVNIGNVYSYQKQYKEAIENYFLALKYLDEIDNETIKATVYNNIGALFYYEHDMEMSIYYLEKGMEIRERLGDISALSASYGNIGSLLIEMGEYEKGKDYIEKAIAINLENNQMASYSGNLINYGEYYMKKGEVAQAVSTYLKAIEISERYQEKVPLLEARKSLMKAYEKQGKFREAFQTQKAYIALKDSLFNEKQIKEISELKGKFEISQKEKELELYKKKEEVREKEMEKNRAVLFAVLGGALLMFFSILLLFKNLRNKEKANRLIQSQKKVVEEQNLILEEKNEEITSSINYAKRLQEAILPPIKVVNSHLTESFILYKPKDIVAGDFYFMDVVEDSGKKLVYYAAADCTGHGVPGAMVSIVGANGLKRCIQEFNLREPGKILDKLAQLVAENFAQSEEKIRDGMDLALCCLEMENNKSVRMHYAGANNPLWVINPNRNKAPENAIPFKQGGGFEIKANKQAIGYTENITPFDSHTIELEEGDTLYTFSDGYPDQFGGESLAFRGTGGKKFKSANFKKLLLNVYDKSMDEQLTIINQTFEDWKGELEQIDDVCVIGVRV